MIPNMDVFFQSKEFAEYLFNNLDVAIFIVDSKNLITRANDPFKTLFSISDEKLLNRIYGDAMKCKFAHLQNGHCGDAEACKDCPIQQSIKKALSKDQKTTISYIPWEFMIDGTTRIKHLKFTCKPITFSAISFAIISVHDITELEEQKQQIRDMANHDFLTGLANRRYFFEVGESFFLTAKRNFIDIGIAMLDIDYFKKVNDEFGHAAGDYVIKEIGLLIKSYLRKTDIISRFGGEEFCLLLQCATPKNALFVLEKIRKGIESHNFTYGDKKIPVTISSGLTLKLGASLDEMIDRADDLLYNAKRNGRNRIENDLSSLGSGL